LPQECDDGEFVAGFWLAGFEVTVVNPICATLAEIQSGAPCPCFDGSSLPGRGIDYMPELLVDTICLGTGEDFLSLRGFRGEPPFIWSAGASIDTYYGPHCSIYDFTIDFNEYILPLTSAQLHTCLQIMLDSEMFALNDCPPGD
jgi:hypothetical protein